MKAKLIIYFLCMITPIATLSQEIETDTVATESNKVDYQALIEEFGYMDGLEYSSLGISLRDMATGEEIASFDPDLAVTTASTMKVVTSATALELLGYDYRFHTRVRLDGEVADSVVNGNLVVIGGCDPTLGTRRENNKGSLPLEIATKLKSLGIKRINGRILTDESLITDMPIYQKWQVEDIASDYGTGVHAINYRDNVVTLKIDKKGVASFSPAVEMRVENHTKKGDKDLKIMQCFGDRPMVSLYGTMSGAISEVIANPNPGALLVKDIKAELRQRGIAVGDSVINVARGEEIIDFESDMLRNILRTLLLKSDNMYTESVLRAIAIKQGGGHSMEDGVEAVKKYWCGRGLQTGALFMYDGSGLSRNDRCTASLMTQILRAVEADSAKIGLKMSTLMTRLGEDGNIGNGKAVKRSAACGKIASKSGSMVDVQCYAGYYPYDEPRYAWAILVNNFSMTRNALKERIDRLLARLFSE